MVGGRLAATLSQLNSTFQPTSSHPTYRSNQPNTLGCSWIKYGHVLYRLITRLNSYGSFFIFSSSYSSFLSTTTMDSGSHSLTTPSNLHQVIQPIDQINQIPKDAHGSSMVKFYINLSYDLALKS